MLPTLQRLLCVIFLSAAAAARPFDAGPMLLEPGPTGMTVVVYHATPVAPTLTYHPADRPDEKSTSARGERGTRHAFVLTGLAPDTRYQYRVTAGEWNSGPCTFHTPPADPEKYLMLAAGDLRTQPDRFREVAEAMRKHEPRALCWITTGDFPADGRDYRMWLRHFFIPGRELLSTIPIWPCIGNARAHAHQRRRTRSRQPLLRVVSLRRRPPH
ncbi:hypothetical protein HS125_12705 [bacterium]|nr:hypothetical protein [bacterium]